MAGSQAAQIYTTKQYNPLFILLIHYYNLMK